MNEQGTNLNIQRNQVIRLPIRVSYPSLWSSRTIVKPGFISCFSSILFCFDLISVMGAGSRDIVLGSTNLIWTETKEPQPQNSPVARSKFCTTRSVLNTIEYNRIK